MSLAFVVNSAAYLSYFSSIMIEGGPFVYDGDFVTIEGGPPILLPDLLLDGGIEIPSDGAHQIRMDGDVVSIDNFSFDVLMTDPSGVAGTELGWTHWSIDANSIFVSGLDFRLGFTPNLSLETSHVWEVLSSSSPISYGEVPELFLEAGDADFMGDFELVTEESSISIHYTPVPESGFLGLFFGLVALVVAHKSRRPH